MSKTYQEFASENLALFNWQLTPEQIPELSVCKKVLNGIVEWFNSNPEVTRRVIDDADISVGLYNQGFFTDWPALYNCFAQARSATSPARTTTSSPASNEPSTRSTSNPATGSPTSTRSSATPDAA